MLSVMLSVTLSVMLSVTLSVMLSVIMLSVLAPNLTDHLSCYHFCVKSLCMLTTSNNPIKPVLLSFLKAFPNLTKPNLT